MRKVKSVVVVPPKQPQQFTRKFTLQKKACNVWIVGDSYVRRGEKQAKETIGTNLGVSAHIQWFGRGGMCWEQVLPFLYQCLQGRTAPDVLLIHCGGNDLGRLKTMLLVTAMQRDLQNFHRQFPKIKIMLSTINQRRQWRYAPPAKVDKARKFVNSAMTKFLFSVNGRTVDHPRILFDNPRLFLSDNVHLSSQGNDIFFSDIAQGLKDHVL